MDSLLPGFSPLEHRLPWPHPSHRKSRKCTRAICPRPPGLVPPEASCRAGIASAEDMRASGLHRMRSELAPLSRFSAVAVVDFLTLRERLQAFVLQDPGLVELLLLR